MLFKVKIQYFGYKKCANEFQNQTSLSGFTLYGAVSGTITIQVRF